MGPLFALAGLANAPSANVKFTPHKVEFTMRKLLTATMFWAVAASGQAHPQPQADASAPSATDAPPQFYPDKAQRFEVNGKVVLDCAITSERKLEECTVVSETPVDYGFGDAALRMSKILRMDPNGPLVIKGRATIPISFKVPR